MPKRVEELRCFSSHGVEDPTLPVEWARKGIALLEERKIALTYKEYPAGHGINPDNFSDLITCLNATLICKVDQLIQDD